jgi:hypothetical protein
MKLKPSETVQKQNGSMYAVAKRPKKDRPTNVKLDVGLQAENLPVDLNSKQAGRPVTVKL